MITGKISSKIHNYEQKDMKNEDPAFKMTMTNFKENVNNVTQTGINRPSLQSKSDEENDMKAEKQSLSKYSAEDLDFKKLSISVQAQKEINT